MSKLFKLMEVTIEELEKIEGIDSGVASTIVETRDEAGFIDLLTVANITGMSKKALKKLFIEPSPLLCLQSMMVQHKGEVTTFQQDFVNQVGELKQELTEINKKSSEIDGVRESVEALGIRLHKVEQSQLMATTIQFKNPVTPLDDGKTGQPVDHMDAMSVNVGALMDQ